MEWRDKKQNVHQRADLTAIPRNFKRLIGSCRRALAIAKQPLGQRSKAQNCGSRVLAETRSKRTMLDGVIKRDCSIEVIDCSILVGSTALSARMDPEDLREVISAYQTCVAENVGRFGGFVAKYMGDGVLVYFGYPQAHEDDTERAVRAGVELVAAVGQLKTHAPLQTRVGVATGLVVVGDLIGSGASQEQAIVGETPNLAARLQADDRIERAVQTRYRAGAKFDAPPTGASLLR
jgi:class 3 adenylate cyclase